MDADSPIISHSDAVALSILPPANTSDADSHARLDSRSTIIPLADELRSAERIQRSLLPQHFPTIKGWDIAGFCSAAGPLGGDFYDVQGFGTNHLFVVADVMGKGIPAALIASVLRIVIRNAAIGASGPGEILRKANELIYEDLSNADMYVTMQAVWLDTESEALTVAGAGHCPLLVRNHARRVQSILPGGIPIGVAPRVTYAEEILSLNDIDLLCMFTDGVTEARNTTGENFGAARLAHWLSEAEHLPSEHLKEEIEFLLGAFEEGVRKQDDQTMLILRKYL